GPRFSAVINGHYTTGWASYVETLPTKHLLDGIGIWGVPPNKPENCDNFFRRCAELGIRHLRWEIGFGSGQYRTDATKPYRISASHERRLLAGFCASKKHKVKILVLINSHEGMPCPAIGFGAKFLSDAKKGQSEFVLSVDKPELLKAGYSGISNLTRYAAAKFLLNKIEKADAKTYGENAFAITLAKPLPKDMPKGKGVQIHTLQYRPFGDPKTDAATYKGWGRHALRIAELAKEAGIEDGEVDFELWNELTFGTMFLKISRYDPAIKGGADRQKMLLAGAKAIRKYFPKKTQVVNGFSNTTFFGAGQFAGKYPEGISAESYHPYGFNVFEWPEHATKGRSYMKDSRNVDGFVPKYVTCFPEQHGNYLMSHTLVSLMQPGMREKLKKRDGMVGDKFMTECGMWIHELPKRYREPIEKAGRGAHVLAKFAYRLYPFYLNKGLTAVDGGTFSLSGEKAKIIRSGAEKHIEQWRPVMRMAKMLEPMTTPLDKSKVLQLKIKAWKTDAKDYIVYDAKDALQLDPKIKPKTMYYRDVLCVLPFQANPTDFAVAAYIQTRNIIEDHDNCGTYRLEFPQLAGREYTVTVEDPFKGKAHPFTDASKAGGPVAVSMVLPDYPVWILIRKK
ncbi:MAG: hypothetical protein QF662_01040, partial [Phycisphaerae bacterium]|nr:hypothetical protein [Phycisphaerae bacterium]